MTLQLTKFRLSVPFSPQNRLPKWWVVFCSLYSFPFYHTCCYYEFVTARGQAQVCLFRCCTGFRSFSVLIPRGMLFVVVLFSDFVSLHFQLWVSCTTVAFFQFSVIASLSRLHFVFSLSRRIFSCFFARLSHGICMFQFSKFASLPRRIQLLLPVSLAEFQPFQSLSRRIQCFSEIVSLDFGVFASLSGRCYAVHAGMSCWLLALQQVCLAECQTVIASVSLNVRRLQRLCLAECQEVIASVSR